MSHGPLVMQWGDVPPIKAVLYDREHGPDGADSGYLVAYSDTPSPAELDEAAEPDTTWVCMHCLIDEHPEVGAALDLAREVGEVWLVDGEWVPLDEIPEGELPGEELPE